MRFKYLLALLFLIFTNIGFAQNSKTGNWLIYFGNQAVTKKLNWWNEVQHRNYNFIGDLQQLLIRTGIGYNLTENNNNVLLGYAFVNTQKYLGDNKTKIGSNEHRLYQQFITKQNFGRVFLQHRYRIEERFFKNDFQMRFRYFISLNVPINHTKMIAKTLYASTYNEIFINKSKPLFDRNRIYGGLGYILNKNIKVELGFMNQSLENTGRNQFQIIFHNNLPLYK